MPPVLGWASHYRALSPHCCEVYGWRSSALALKAQLCVVHCMQHTLLPAAQGWSSCFSRRSRATSGALAIAAPHPLTSVTVPAGRVPVGGRPVATQALSVGGRGRRYAAAARRAVDALWSRRSAIDLVGSHIDINSGLWTQQQATLGTNVDSFFEYLLKSHLLFGDKYPPPPTRTPTRF